MVSSSGDKLKWIWRLLGKHTIQAKLTFKMDLQQTIGIHLDEQKNSESGVCHYQCWFQKITRYGISGRLWLWLLVYWALIFQRNAEGNSHALIIFTFFLLWFSSRTPAKILQHKPMIRMIFLKKRKLQFMFKVCKKCLLAMYNIVIKMKANKRPMLCPQILILHHRYKLV